MALINCKDCKKEFSTDAKRCPHCGASQSQGGPGLGTFFLIVLGMIVVGSMIGNGNSKKDVAKNPRDYVLDTCMSFTKDSLHDRESAEFDYPYPTATELSGNEFSMILPLRAKNGFGAMRHFAVECVVRFNGDTWSLVKLNEVKS